MQLLMHNINTRERRKELQKLIESKQFGSQEGLLKRLHTSGFKVTQGTLSRDLAKLNVVKRGGAYAIGPVGYALNGVSKVISMQYVEPNIIIIKTTPGLAQAAAMLIDQSNLSGIAGTVAGDDTIITIINTPKSHSQLVRKLSSLFSRTRSGS